MSLLSSNDQEFINSQRIGPKFDMNGRILPMGFLPTSYELPKTGGNYMKFQDGKNRFRILDSAITGYEWWIDGADGKRTPGRAKSFQEAVERGVEPLKHFWAFPVWNCDKEAVQILEITQKGIQTAIKSLVEDADWGDPKEYDITVTKTGQKLDTTYTVQPSPKKPIDELVPIVYKDMNINLQALYTGADPFSAKE